MGKNLNGVNQCTISYGASKDLILAYKVQQKPMIKAHFSGRMVSGISDVVIASVYSEKIHLKKLMMMMIMIISMINSKRALFLAVAVARN